MKSKPRRQSRKHWNAQSPRAFDLYVLDKRLPDGSGMELCVRLNGLTPGVPCIFYTGDAYEIHRQEAMVAGATAYVPKPDVEALNRHRSQNTV